MKGSRCWGWGVVLAAVFWAHSGVRADVGDQRRTLALDYYRGLVYFESGHYDEALAEFRKVADIDPEYKFVRRYLEKAEGILKTHRADVLGVQETEVEEGGSDLYFVGKSFFEKGDYRRAAEAFKAVLAKDPGDHFAQYYLRLCEQTLGEKVETVIAQGGVPAPVDKTSVLERSVAYMKDDIEERQAQMSFYEKKAERRMRRDETIRKKEQALERQRELLEEEREDYLAERQLSAKAERLGKEMDKWRTMRERLESKEPGVAADLTDYPVTLNRGEQYYKLMEEALRASRWQSASLNALSAAVAYCDAVLIYYNGVKSVFPAHSNIISLLKDNVRRADADEHIEHLRAMFSLQAVVEDEARAYTRSDALFLADKAKKIVAWCRTFLP
ncbi:MAG: tetratricopeptide repeat protein [Deltaproteobacteria bacterium]